MNLGISWRVLGALCAGLVASSLPLHSSAVGATEPSANELRVGSFNVVGVQADAKAHGDQNVWRVRRAKIVSQILAQKLDVVGVQELNQSSIYKSHLNYGDNQYLDLLGALNAKGGHYALTNTNAYNCVKPASTYKCVYKNQNSSGDNRIFYDTTKISMINQGATTYSAHAAGKPERYLAWATLQQKATGKRFLFTTTHLDPYDISARQKQWDQLISTVNSVKGYLPVIATGDFNTSKFSPYAATYLPRMKQNGYSDVLNQVPGKNTLSSPRAETVYRAWVASFNDFRRNVADFGYEDARTKIGNGIDWIFASNNLEVKRWEVVVDVDPSTLKLRGVIPSDHCLVVSTLVL
jgi:endonuclease/exonuclease/phosphatase family metal-dependent hydrolase